MKGLGHAILTGRELIGDEPFAVVLADDLCVNDQDGVLAQMVRYLSSFAARLSRFKKCLLMKLISTELSQVR